MHLLFGIEMPFLVYQGGLSPLLGVEMWEAPKGTLPKGTGGKVKF